MRGMVTSQGASERARDTIVSEARDMEVFPRITVEADKCAGKPCIRGYRLPVENLLLLLADGATREELLAEWDFLEGEDITATLRFAAHLASQPAHAELADRRFRLAMFEQDWQRPEMDAYDER